MDADGFRAEVLDHVTAHVRGNHDHIHILGIEIAFGLCDGTDADAFAVHERQHVELAAGVVLDAFLEFEAAQREVEQIVLS